MESDSTSSIDCACGKPDIQVWDVPFSLDVNGPMISNLPFIIITSNYGNVAFEVNFTQEEHTKRLSVRGKHSSQWKEMVKSSELNCQTTLKNRCAVLKKRNKRTQKIRQQKASNSTLNLKDCFECRTNNRLSLIEEDFSKASIKLANLPKPFIIITSNFGNVAFEVNFAQEKCPHIMRNNPKRFTAMSKYADRGEHGSQWKERSEFNYQDALKNQVSNLTPILEDYCEGHTNHNLSPKEELAILPLPSIIIITSKGNMAFEINFTQEGCPPMRNILKRFFVMSNNANRGEHHRQWKERMRRSEMNRQASLKNRFDTLKKWQKRAQCVKHRKASNYRPHVHAISLLQELQINTNTTAPVTKIGDTAIRHGGMAFEIFLPKGDHPCTTDEDNLMEKEIPTRQEERESLTRKFHQLQHHQDKQQKNIISSRSINRGGVAPATTNHSGTTDYTTTKIKQPTCTKDDFLKNKAPPSQPDCALQYKLDRATHTQNQQVRLTAICKQNCQSEREKNELATREIVHIKPLSSGTSLLCELPSAPNVEARPPSCNGERFTINSGSYNPNARVPLTWSEFRSSQRNFLSEVVPSSSDVPSHSQEQDYSADEYDCADEPEAGSYQQQNLPEACAYEQQNSQKQGTQNSQQQGTHEKLQQKPDTLLQPDKEEASKCAKYHKSKPKLLCYQIIDGKKIYIEDYQIPEIGTKNLGCVFYLSEDTNNLKQETVQLQQLRKCTSIEHAQRQPNCTCGSTQFSTEHAQGQLMCGRSQYSIELEHAHDQGQPFSSKSSQFNIEDPHFLLESSTKHEPWRGK